MEEIIGNIENGEVGVGVGVRREIDMEGIDTEEIVKEIDIMIKEEDGQDRDHDHRHMKGIIGGIEETGRDGE